MAEFKCPSCGHISRRPALSPDGGEVERVARALCKLPGNDPDREVEPGHPLWKEFVLEAETAIRSLASPGESSSGSREEREQADPG